MPAIKVCGIKDVATAELAVELGVEMIGLNFYPPSPRYVSMSLARSITRAVSGKALIVGVFVDEDRARVEEVASSVGLDLLQFHGTESMRTIGALASCSIKAFRVEASDGELPDASSYETCWGLLFDTGDPQLHGGTGRMWDHGLLARPSRRHPRVFLAGGLNPENVAQVLENVVPFAVDVCSGVESAPGIKDPTLMRRFVEEVRNGEDRSAA